MGPAFWPEHGWTGRSRRWVGRLGQWERAAALAVCLTLTALPPTNTRAQEWVGSGIAPVLQQRAVDTEPVTPPQLAPVVDRRKPAEPGATRQQLAPVFKQSPAGSRERHSEGGLPDSQASNIAGYGPTGELPAAVAIDLRGSGVSAAPLFESTTCLPADAPAAAGPDRWPAVAAQVPVTRLRTGHYVPDRAGRLQRVIPRTTPNLPAAPTPSDDVIDRPLGNSNSIAAVSPGEPRG